MSRKFSQSHIKEVLIKVCAFILEIFLWIFVCTNNVSFSLLANLLPSAASLLVNVRNDSIRNDSVRNDNVRNDSVRNDSFIIGLKDKLSLTKLFYF